MEYYSQFQTDKHILNNYLPQDNFHGVLVEVGAGHPDIISMSKAFRNKGWRVICIEPNPRYCQLHRDQGNEVYQYAISDHNEENVDFEIYIDIKGRDNGNEDALQGMSYSAIKARQEISTCMTKEITKVNLVTLNWLLDKLEIDHVDVISIDVEGWEMEVLTGFNTDKYKPTVIMLEDYTVSHKVDEKYMNSLGYKVDMRFNHDVIYTRDNKLLAKRNI